MSYPSHIYEWPSNGIGKKMCHVSVLEMESTVVAIHDQ
jgi:hypothetical protein